MRAFIEKKSDERTCAWMSRRAKDNVARFIEITSEDLDFECFCLARARGKTEMTCGPRSGRLASREHPWQAARATKPLRQRFSSWTIFLAASELRLAVFYRKTSGLASAMVFSPVHSRRRHRRPPEHLVR